MTGTIPTAFVKIRRSTSSRSVLVFLGMLGIAALCVGQAPTAKPILTPAPQPQAPAATTPEPATPAPTATSTPAGTSAPTGTTPADAAATPATPVAPAPVPVEGSSYIIGPDDVLQVTVWKEATLSGTFPVRPDGMISMVLLGDVKAAGLTPSQLASTLTTQYKKYVQDPLVTVLVEQVNSQRIFMVGEVGHVGPVPITPGMTPLQAIAAAGGLSPYAHKNRIYILRGPQGKQEKIPFNYKAALRGDNSQNISLLPNDTVVVP